jgi:pimeloyl-ACP methyl ester carboxylesterase
MNSVARYTIFVMAAGAILSVPALMKFVTNTVLEARYPVPGSFFPVNGRLMHVYCAGHGSPTVVLNAGGGDDWLIWQKVQPEASKTMRVCSYERAGTGWSESQPGVRDANNISQQPFVLVSASVAGFFAREYVDRYPAEVAGLVLVDRAPPNKSSKFQGPHIRQR